MHLSSSKKRLVLAVGCGVLAAILVAVYTGDLQAQAAQQRQSVLANYGGEQVEVLVATRDIVAGETLDANNCAMQPWLADLLPVGAFTSPDDAFGKQLSVPVLRNEPLVAAKIGNTAEQIAVPEGLYALSIPVEDVSAVGGAIVPGTAVDVYATGATAVQLVASDVMVLESSNGYGSATLSDSGSGSAAVFGGSNSRVALKWVTLAVNPNKVAELLAAARDKNLSLVLPGENASTVAPDSNADLAVGGGDK
jgi:pilus assembly protein CpaB